MLPRRAPDTIQQPGGLKAARSLVVEFDWIATTGWAIVAPP
jgi:hypothetical protein